MNRSLIDGYISHDQIVTGLDSAHPIVASGMAISLPATDHASIAYRNTLEDELRSIFRLLPPEMALQIRWNQEGDFSEELARYYQATQDPGKNPWVRRHRQQHFIRYSRLQEEGLLKRKQVSLFLSSKLKRGSGRAKSRHEEFLQSSASAFAVVFREMEQSLKRLGGRSFPLDDQGLFEECYRHLNPSQSRIGFDEIVQNYRPDETILTNCLSGQMSPFTGEDAGFYYDGVFHGFLALKALPQASYSGLIDLLTTLPVGGFSVVANIERLDVTREVDLEEKEIAKLERSVRSHRKPQTEEAIVSKRDRISRLLSGEVMPFQMQFLLHARGRAREELADRMAALKAALNRMQGTRYWEMMLPTTARDCFLATTPGMSFREKDFFLKVEDHTLANLVPVAGGSNDSLKDAEAIFQGPNGSLLGVSTFVGAQGNQTPLHMAVAGTTGGGKSVGMIELLTQTVKASDFTCIFDNGLSYGTFVRVFDPDARTLILETNGNESLNYLDTRGKALTAGHLADATAVVHLMVGHSGDPSKNRHRSAVITKYLNRFYKEWAKKWRESGNDRATIPDESQNDYREWFRFMKPDEVPRHRDFCDWLENQLEQSSSKSRELEQLCLIAADWKNEGGKHGPILDGWSTVDFSRSILHFELGRLDSASSTLQDLVTFVIATIVRREITYRPRGQKKRVVFEEMGAFLELSGARKIVRDYFERGRKYNCWCVAVIQQISNIPEDLARSVLGNCKQGLFFRQQYEAEVRALQKALCLPEESATSLLSLPHPTPEGGAAFLYWQSHGTLPLVSRGFNITTPEMLYVSGSGGEEHDLREVSMAKYADPLEGVIAEVEKLQKTSPSPGGIS